VIADTNVVIKWDGIDKGLETWNQDHDMRMAFRNSTVWFYQELARRIGTKRMQHYVREAGYGNKNIGGAIDEFWLNGDIRITMREQIKFLRKLYQNKLPFSRETMERVKGIMNYLATDKYTLYAKTGWTTTQNIGWFVGFVIQDYEIEIPLPPDTQDSLAVPEKKRIRNGYYFALNIDMDKAEDAPARESITIDILKSLNII